MLIEIEVIYSVNASLKRGEKRNNAKGMTKSLTAEKICHIMTTWSLPAGRRTKHRMIGRPVEDR